MYNGSTSDCHPFRILQGSCDFIYSTIDLSFQSKVAVFADLNNSDLMSRIHWLQVRHCLERFVEAFGELMSTSASRSTSSSRQPFSTADLRHCAMMLGVMEESYCREVCFSLPGWGSHIGGGALVSLMPALVRVVSDVRFPHFSCFGSDGPLAAQLVCTAATDFINETSVLLLVEGVEHVPSFRLSGEPCRTAAIFRRERRVLRLRPMFMPIRSDCAMSQYPR